MKRHRAAVLILMMIAAIGLFVLMTAGAVATFDAHSLIALGVVLGAAVISGVAFSWNRYFKKPN